MTNSHSKFSHILWGIQLSPLLFIYCWWYSFFSYKVTLVRNEIFEFYLISTLVHFFSSFYAQKLRSSLPSTKLITVSVNYIRVFIVEFVRCHRFFRIPLVLVYELVAQQSMQYNQKPCNGWKVRLQKKLNSKISIFYSTIMLICFEFRSFVLFMLMN